MRTIEIAALNITMHQPHSADRYVSMMKAAYRLRQVVQLGELHAALLGSLYVEDSSLEKNVDQLSGEIYRFVNLQVTEPWFNVKTGDAATEEDVREISIPEHLLPHLKRIPFVFRPKTHQLLYISKDRRSRFGTSTAVKFFQRLFDRLVDVGDFPEIDVTAIADSDALDKMLALPTLQKLTIELKRPNPDDLGSEHARWLGKLERENARKVVTELTSVRGESLTPDRETKSLAQVAANNGMVHVVGRDASGIRIEESTVNRPLLMNVRIDDKIETATQVLQRTKI